MNYMPGIKYFPQFQLESLLKNYVLGGHNEEDSKQAAEAMVQLSGVGYYNQQGERKIFFLFFFRYLI